MRNKVLKIACSIAIAAFIKSPAQQAKAATNTNQLVTDAQNAGTILKWAISVEGSADYKTRPYNQYNTAKKAIKVAEMAATKLSHSEKLSIQARLVEPKTHVKRAQAYIDAITSSEKIINLTNNLREAIDSTDLDKVEVTYHTATAEYRKQVILLDRVYGQSTRNGIRNAVKPAMEKLIEQVKYDVTVKMYLEKASQFIKENNLAEGAAELEKANYYLTFNAAKFTFRTQLEKSYTDIEASLPLQPLAVSSDGQNMVIVHFSKEYSIPLAGLEAGQFKISGETVQDAKLSEDKKLVILTTSDLNSSTNYMVTWKDHKMKFATEAVVDTTGIILFDTNDSYLETSNNHIYRANLTNLDGSPYVGRVRINLSEANTTTETTSTTAVITSANGHIGNAGQELTVYTDQNGNLTFIIATADATSATFVQPTIQKLDGNQKSKKAPMTHFFQLQNSSDFYELSIVDPYIYTEDNYIFTGGFKYKWDANDLFFIHGQRVSQEVFETALSNGDSVTAGYEIKPENISTWNITSEVTKAAKLEITNPAHTPVTYDGSSYIISGTAQAGYTVHVYRNGVFIGTAKVDENGEWTVGSISILQNEANKFEAYQYAPGKDGNNGVGSENPTNPATATINEGAFASTEITLNDNNDNGLSIFDTLDFTFINPSYGNEFKKALTGTVTINDGFGRNAVVKVEYIDGDTLEVVEFVSVEPEFTHHSSTLIIIATSGIVNQDQLAYNATKSNSNGPVIIGTIK
ncbi:hypothetical protein [Psychrobacillus sp. OK032]|uniref:hypothetical protein n=1 Tax=Psychrobacillus sp. OK032 TaxID=1884358 RepID=UPI0008B1F4E8|nr:hypothetical protein [Psychrobacillus sp. OK032]SES04155.1 hypothetical protein SAMN05518872_103377 [Psychrobacillus sp. OK032]